MSGKIELLAAGFVPPDALAELDSRYLVHRYFEAEDQAAMLVEIQDKIVCIVGTSHADIPASLINALPKLKQISIYGTGYEKIAVEAAFARGIVVTNTPDVMTHDVADLGMALILAVVRRIVIADSFVKADRSRSESMPFSRSIRGLKLGIVGLGKIGMEVAIRAQAFSMDIAYLNRQPRNDVSYLYFDDLKAMASHVDVLILCAPGGDETYHMINTEVLNALGPQGILINIARGSIVDEQALVLALKEQRLGAAGLDVFKDLAEPPEELYSMENVVLSPHRGSATLETRGAMARLMVSNVGAGMAGKALLSPIN